MVRHYSSARIRSQLRQAEQKIRQAQNLRNQKVRRLQQQVKSAVNKYNQKARAYNARVRANRMRLRNELNRLARKPSVTLTRRYVVYRTSVEVMHRSYVHLEEYANSHELDPRYSRVLDLSERETANGLALINRLLGDEVPEEPLPEADELGALGDSLRLISPELHARWNGANYAINPRNPDAARHFCTSAREIMTQILHLKAPDAEVFRLLPDAKTAPGGSATRRSRIRYLLKRKGMALEMLEDFVVHNVDNVMELFDIFNEGTHGVAGTFDTPTLRAIRRRVEDGIMFLTEIASLERHG